MTDSSPTPWVRLSWRFACYLVIVSHLATLLLVNGFHRVVPEAAATVILLCSILSVFLSLGWCIRYGLQHPTDTRRLLIVVFIVLLAYVALSAALILPSLFIL